MRKSEEALKFVVGYYGASTVEGFVSTPSSVTLHLGRQQYLVFLNTSFGITLYFPMNIRIEGVRLSS